MDRDLYTVLGVPVTATQEEIREAYLRVSRVVHPDRFDPARQPIEWKQANEMRCFIRELLLTFSLSSTTCDSSWVSRGFSVIKHV